MIADLFWCPDNEMELPLTGAPIAVPVAVTWEYSEYLEALVSSKNDIKKLSKNSEGLYFCPLNRHHKELHSSEFAEHLRQHHSGELKNRKPFFFFFHFHFSFSFSFF